MAMLDWSIAVVTGKASQVEFLSRIITTGIGHCDELLARFECLLATKTLEEMRQVVKHAVGLVFVHKEFIL